MAAWVAPGNTPQGDRSPNPLVCAGTRMRSWRLELGGVVHPYIVILCTSTAESMEPFWVKIVAEEDPPLCPLSPYLHATRRQLLVMWEPGKAGSGDSLYLRNKVNLREAVVFSFFRGASCPPSRYGGVTTAYVCSSCLPDNQDRGRAKRSSKEEKINSKKKDRNPKQYRNNKTNSVKRDARKTRSRLGSLPCLRKPGRGDKVCIASFRYRLP